MSSLKSRMQN